MLDPNAVKAILEEEIKREVQSAVSQQEWIADLEGQIIEHVQARITAKFSNISTVPDLVDTVRAQVEQLFENGFVPNISEIVDDSKLNQAIDQAVENLVANTIENLTMNSDWVEKVQTLATQRMTDRVASALKDIDLNSKLTSIVLDHKQVLLQSLSEDFVSNGIQDKANTLQLTIMDGVIVVENELVANQLESANDALVGGDLTVNGSLAVKGRINTDNPSWQELANTIGDKAYNKIKETFSYDLKEEMLAQIQGGINLEDVYVNGTPLLSRGELAGSVSGSALTKVGTLRNLSVAGRIGVNTENPTNALSIWDEEVALGIGKQQLNTAYIGTTKKQALNIGTNQQSTISINNEGDLWVKNLQIGRNKISHASKVPGYEGAKGDIVFNINYKKGEPFAWMCLGAFRWAELKA